MKFENLSGKQVSINLHKYAIDWDGKERSIIQFKVKKFLQKYWQSHFVCAELRIVSTRMTLDIYNATRKIAVEVQGNQHESYNKFFHAGSRMKYLGQLKRDTKKHDFCERNGITLVEVTEAEVPVLSAKWFLEHYNITL